MRVIYIQIFLILHVSLKNIQLETDSTQIDVDYKVYIELMKDSDHLYFSSDTIQNITFNSKGDQLLIDAYNPFIPASLNIICSVYDTQIELSVYGCNISFDPPNKQMSTFIFGAIFTLKKSLPYFSITSQQKIFRFDNKESNYIMMVIEHVKINMTMNNKTSLIKNPNGEDWCIKSDSHVYCGFMNLILTDKDSMTNESSCPEIFIYEKYVGYSPKWTVIITLIPVQLRGICNSKDENSTKKSNELYDEFCNIIESNLDQWCTTFCQLQAFMLIAKINAKAEILIFWPYLVIMLLYIKS
ncbi:hypothetical protein RF11_08710 [Thelohanellus kitauei]|uniref:Uncharacterized protein n=1 Tax=Thelohanellus kitauei TaxID=669202 RepID=A0A0C2JBE2_THEKT|nr:hypothetical protein RF11_08710 [Thelohanellus kitauei]